MKISLIVARDMSHAIGREGGMPWSLQSDLKRFRRITLGHKVVMGANTFRSIKFMPLDGRENIVLSSSLDKASEFVVVLRSFDEVMSYLNANTTEDEEVFVIGGGKLYEQFLAHASKAYVTIVDSESEGADTFFPRLNSQEWQMVDEESDLYYKKGYNDDYHHIFCVYKRTDESI